MEESYLGSARKHFDKLTSEISPCFKKQYEKLHCAYIDSTFSASAITFCHVSKISIDP